MVPPIVIGIFSCQFVVPFSVKKTRVVIFERSFNGGPRRSVKAGYDFTAKAARTRKNDETFAQILTR